MPQRTKLKNLIIDRVDLVKEGDNPEAHISLFKRKPEGGDDNNLEIEHSISIMGTDKGVFEKFINKLLGKKGDEDVPEKFDLKKFLEGLPEDQRKPLEEELAKVGTLQIDLKKAQDAAAEAEEDKKKAEAEAEEEKKRAAAKKEEDEDEDLEKVLKGLPESVQKLIKAGQVAQETTKNAEYIEKAKPFEGLGVTAAEFGPILKKIADTDSAAYAKVEAVLKAAMERIEKNDILMKELGTGGELGSGNAWKQIETKAAELVKHNASMTKEQAIAKVMLNEPNLYVEYQKELLEGEVQ